MVDAGIAQPLAASGFAGYVFCKLVWRLIVRNGLDPLPPPILAKVQRIVEADILIGAAAGAAILFQADHSQWAVTAQLLTGLFLYYSICIHGVAFLGFVRWRGVA